ncbi:hypothetical protein [Candidatus Enterovibrio altilux]|nr:hypothetical protein [Candidatus Enterovibrio luxaltus]
MLTITTSLKILHWFSAPSLQRLAFVILTGIATSLWLSFYSGEAPTVAEFDAIPTILCIGLGLILLLKSKLIFSQISDNLFVIAIAILLTFPSFQSTLLSLLLLAILIGLRSSNKNIPLRTCALILCVCAIQALTVFYTLKWFTEPVLAIDASLVASILSLATGYGYAIENVYFGPSDHQVLMLRNCSSLPALLSAFTCWFAIARWHNISFSSRECIVISALLVCSLGLNLLRLFSMGLTMQWHAWWHSPEGENTYLFTSSALTLSIIFWGVHYAKTEHTR